MINAASVTTCAHAVLPAQMDVITVAMKFASAKTMPNHPSITHVNKLSTSAISRAVMSATKWIFNVLKCVTRITMTS